MLHPVRMYPLTTRSCQDAPAIAEKKAGSAKLGRESPEELAGSQKI